MGPEEEKTDRLGKITDKIGDIIIVHDSTKQDIAKVAERAHINLKGVAEPKTRRKMKTPKETIISLMPYGDEKSVRRTIAGAIMILSGIAIISVIVSFILITTTTILEQFGFAGGTIVVFIGISVPVGLIAFFVATANKHEKEDYIEKQFK